MPTGGFAEWEAWLGRAGCWDGQLCVVRLARCRARFRPPRFLSPDRDIVALASCWVQRRLGVTGAALRLAGDSCSGRGSRSSGPFFRRDDGLHDGFEAVVMVEVGEAGGWVVGFGIRWPTAVTDEYALHISAGALVGPCGDPRIQGPARAAPFVTSGLPIFMTLGAECFGPSAADSGRASLPILRLVGVARSVTRPSPSGTPPDPACRLPILVSFIRTSVMILRRRFSCVDVYHGSGA